MKCSGFFCYRFSTQNLNNCVSKAFAPQVRVQMLKNNTKMLWTAIGNIQLTHTKLVAFFCPMKWLFRKKNRTLILLLHHHQTLGIVLHRVLVPWLLGFLRPPASWCRNTRMDWETHEEDSCFKESQIDHNFTTSSYL